MPPYFAMDNAENHKVNSQVLTQGLQKSLKTLGVWENPESFLNSTFCCERRKAVWMRLLFAAWDRADLGTALLLSGEMLFFCLFLLWQLKAAVTGYHTDATRSVKAVY